MRQVLEAKLRETGANASVGAGLILGVTVNEVDEAVALWAPYMRQREIEIGRRVQHSHWDWSEKARAIHAASNYIIAAVTARGEIQALALWDEEFETGRHPEQSGSPLIYVHFLATAPWNDGELVTAPRYRGAGTLLVRAGVERSIELGYRGRLGLHALPQAEEYYRAKCQFADLGRDSAGSHKGLSYFEFTPQLANAFIRRVGG